MFARTNRCSLLLGRLSEPPVPASRHNYCSHLWCDDLLSFCFWLPRLLIPPPIITHHHTSGDVSHTRVSNKVGFFHIQLDCTSIFLRVALHTHLIFRWIPGLAIFIITKTPRRPRGSRLYFPSRGFRTRCTWRNRTQAIVPAVSKKLTEAPSTNGSKAGPTAKGTVSVI